MHLDNHIARLHVAAATGQHGCLNFSPQGKCKEDVFWRKEAFPGFSSHSRDTGDYFLYSPKPQIRRCANSTVCPLPARAADPPSPSCHRHSHPQPSPTSTCTWKDTSAELCDSHCDFRSRESSRETPGFSATKTGKQSLRKRCQGPAGHIFPSKHCKVRRGFT